MYIWLLWLGVKLLQPINFSPFSTIHFCFRILTEIKRFLGKLWRYLPKSTQPEYWSSRWHQLWRDRTVPYTKSMSPTEDYILLWSGQVSHTQVMGPTGKPTIVMQLTRLKLRSHKGNQIVAVKFLKFSCWQHKKEQK